MAGRFDLRSPGATTFERMAAMLREQEATRRQSMLDGIEVQSRVAAIQRAEEAARRQAALDQAAAEDRQRRITTEDRAYTDQQERQRIEDARYEAEQRQKVLDRADAAGNRYLDTERGYYEAEQKQKFDAAEAAKDRVSQERRTAMGAAAGQGTTKPTQGQLTADTFYERATDALDAIDEVEESIGGYDLVAPNFMQTGAGQQYHQAKRQFVEAYLRKDSGAAIGKDEYNNADKTYFPQVGDSAATRRRKRAARAKVVESLRLQGTGNSGANTGGPRVRRFNPATGKLE